MKLVILCILSLWGVLASASVTGYAKRVELKVYTGNEAKAKYQEMLEQRKKPDSSYLAYVRVDESENDLDEVIATSLTQVLTDEVMESHETSEYAWGVSKQTSLNCWHTVPAFYKCRLVYQEANWGHQIATWNPY